MSDFAEPISKILVFPSFLVFYREETCYALQELIDELDSAKQREKEGGNGNCKLQTRIDCLKNDLPDRKFSFFTNFTSPSHCTSLQSVDWEGIPRDAILQQSRIQRLLFYHGDIRCDAFVCPPTNPILETIKIKSNELLCPSDYMSVLLANCTTKNNFVVKKEPFFTRDCKYVTTETVRNYFSLDVITILEALAEIAKGLSQFFLPVYVLDNVFSFEQTFLMRERLHFIVFPCNFDIVYFDMISNRFHRAKIDFLTRLYQNFSLFMTRCV